MWGVDVLYLLERLPYWLAAIVLIHLAVRITGADR